MLQKLDIATAYIPLINNANVQQQKVNRFMNIIPFQ